MKMKETTNWSGDFRGVSFEIKNWGRMGWSYYLILPMAQLQNEIYWQDEPTSIHNGHEYFGIRGVPNLEIVESHCSWTFYARQNINNYRTIKIGCDYQHLYDEGFFYQLEDILGDVKASIDSLWEIVPELRVRCTVNGNWYDSSEGVFADGLFHSNAGQDWNESKGFARLPVEKEVQS